MIELPALLMPSRQLQALFAPYPLNPLMLDMLALYSQQFTNLAVSVRNILPDQPDQLQAQSTIVLRRLLVMHRAVRNARRLACAPFRCAKLMTCMNNSLTKVISRQTFGFKKSRLSFKISFSSSRSAKIFFSCWFSFSSTFSS